MLNLSPFGVFHTAIALVAVACGLVALFKHGEIGMRTRSGRLYIWLTAATAFTGLFIFRHGGFGPPHALAILTLAVLAIAGACERHREAGVARYLAVLGYSLTLFFHLIPGLTETGTRIPIGNPAFSGPEDPTLKALVGIGFLVYLSGATVQAMRIRRSQRLTVTP
ncbi:MULTISPECIES: hypothetical protein [Cupriavidus]|uniref:hypothetical protein n=1 Tax=Cupriavidus TaxID=106589 RepID=UPI000E11C9D9|nr:MULTISPECIES: hypothetical protein [Cupriavidus]MEC3767074.1 hypothetical protein [Cupriavidus sp. SS-3]SOY92859.1 conserved hypothetical protein; putative membrane protein [Cupriavidus taiwanensis]SOY98362.1 conserved hypothetical protein; putative membrane protein [Cupriavidus taiwanensis]